MKKALVIFTVSITLIIAGAFMSIAEISAWSLNYDDTKFEKSDFYTIKVDVDISDYDRISIAKYDRLLNDLLVISDVKYNIEAKQDSNIITLELEYYSKIGECNLHFNSIYHSASYLEVYPTCGINQTSIIDVLRFLNSDDFKTMMRNKQIPVKLKSLVISINPLDQAKIIRSR